MNILHKVTRKALAGNRMRTWVTIVGILLSAAMFTAVTTCVSSVQNYLYRVVLSTDGGWHAAHLDADAEAIERYGENREVRDYTVLERIGYAKIESANEYKPYLMLFGISDSVQQLLPIKPSLGRLPQKADEILLPAHLATNGGVDYQLGDVLSLAVGERISEGVVLDQQNPFDPNEGLVIRESRNFTVVGFYERPHFEEYSAPGYSALTYAEGAFKSGDCYLRMHSARDVYSLAESIPEENRRINNDLLRYTGMSNEGSYNRVLYSLAAILIGIICFGSVALIYNAFSISVSERTKQFGILKTVGATKRQLRGSVLYEAMLLSCIGIPLGVLSGILGIGITLYFTGEMFDTILAMGEEVRLRLYVSPGAILIAVVICLITVLISARIPAVRAIRQNAIDSVRNRADIAIRPNKVQTPRWIYKLFGFEGMLADKNFKRNRKKYRATVASLFVSVLLFVSAGSFCAYLTDAGESAVYNGHYDLMYSYNYGDLSSEQSDRLRAEIGALSQVTEASRMQKQYRLIQIDDRLLHPSFLKYRAGQDAEKAEQAALIGESYQPDHGIGAYQYFLEDEAFRQWALEQKIDPAPYFSEPMGIAVDQVIKWDSAGDRYDVLHYLKGEQAEYSYEFVPSEMDGYQWFNAIETEDGGIEYLYCNEAGEELRLSAEDPRFHYRGKIGAVAKEDPFGTNRSSLYIIYPYSMYDRLIPDRSQEQVELMIKSEEPAIALAQLEQLMQRLQPDWGYSLVNMASGNETNRAMIIVINVFSYGFIILISLIALANVFNTISTNIALRRREFAMLRSVGQTEKGLNKMMNYECILYGLKGLSYGLIAAVGVTFLIYRAIDSGIQSGFYIPWYCIAIAVGSVFLVVFSTMLYAMRKIKKEDPIEALKDENM